MSCSLCLSSTTDSNEVDILLQVFKAYQGKPGAVVLQDSPLLVLAGDGFVNSGFDNCIESATKVVEHIVCYNGKISKTEKV